MTLLLHFARELYKSLINIETRLPLTFANLLLCNSDCGVRLLHNFLHCKLSSHRTIGEPETYLCLPFIVGAWANWINANFAPGRQIHTLRTSDAKMTLYYSLVSTQNHHKVRRRSLEILMWCFLGFPTPRRRNGIVRASHHPPPVHMET
jgi:hypothetical protein